MRILITGGCGFVGSSLALAFRREYPAAGVVAFDNLRRRGSELNVGRLARHGVTFVHGDVRVRADLDDLPGTFDVVIDAAAEPSVHAGAATGAAAGAASPDYVVHANLVGTLNCLELARRRAGRVVFLSTSRVYSIAPLRALALVECPTRLELAEAQPQPGASAAGIAEGFPTHLPRSLYGATKLASELLVQEYAAGFGVPAVIDRCGVIAGPGQFGRVDQGVVSLWVARHHFGGALRYTGWGGTGKQVRDLLHPDDLFALLLRQLDDAERCAGEAFNVGGGRPVSVSLAELTTLCREATGRTAPIGAEPETAAVDVPLYLSDTTRARERFAWTPTRSAAEIVGEIAGWMRENEAELGPIFG